MQSKLPDRNKERAEFLTQHLESEITRLEIEYLTEMSSIDRVHAAATMCIFLTSRVAGLFALLARDPSEWRILVNKFIENIKKHEGYIDFDGTSYVSQNGRGEYER